MIFLIQKPEAFGLDISDLSLKLAMFEKTKDGLNLTSFGRASIPSGIVEHGEVKKEKELAELIKKTVLHAHGKRIRTKYVVCSLPEEKAFLDVIRMPPVIDGELEEAVRLEAENYIPLPIDSVYLDSEIVRPLYDHVKNIEVLVGAVPKNIVDSYVRTVKLAGYQPVAMEIESLAISRDVIPPSQITQSLLIIDLGATRTSIIIFGEKSVRFTTTIPVSSQGLTDSISRVLNVTREDAEKMKITYGMQKKEIFEAIIPPLTDLIEQIKTHLDYYYSHAPRGKHLGKSRVVKEIILCGGGALLKGLPEFLESELKIEVKLANPWVNILKKPLKQIPELPYEKSLGYTTALGLALRGVKCSNET